MSDERVLATFLELVRIDSPSGREGALAAHCAAMLAESGFEVRIDETAPVTGSDTGNLIAWLPGNAPGRTVVLSAHLDCVQPCEGVVPVVLDGVVRSDGPTVLGADDKAGVAVLLEMARRLAADEKRHAGVRIVLTVREELGLKGAKALSSQDVVGDLAIVLDADGPVGGIVTAAPTHHTFAAVFRGRAAHAGVEPEKGVSALTMAARAITAMRLGRLDEGTTANVGTIEGGTATNVVPASVRLAGECRSLDAARAQELCGEMDTVMRQAAGAGGGDVEVVWTREYQGFAFDEDEPLVLLAKDACRRAGVEPRTFATGGGSDGNVLASLGVPTLVFSCGMSSVHGTDESIPVAEIERLAAVVEAVLDLAVD